MTLFLGGVSGHYCVKKMFKAFKIKMILYADRFYLKMVEKNDFKCN